MIWVDHSSYFHEETFRIESALLFLMKSLVGGQQSAVSCFHSPVDGFFQDQRAEGAKNGHITGGFSMSEHKEGISIHHGVDGADCSGHAIMGHGRDFVGLAFG